MRWIDLIGLPLASLGQQKLRSCLTTLGVVFGAFVLAASLSIGEGVQQTIDRESSKGDIARKVTVSPGWRPAEPREPGEVKVDGRMAPERRERIRKVLEQRARQGGSGREQVSLTPERLEELSRIPHVRQMVPIVGGGVVAILGNRPEEASVSSGAGEDPEFRKRVVVGRAFESDGERSVLLSEMFAHRIGLVDDADLEQVIGRPLRIELRARDDGPSVNVVLSDRTKGGDRDAQAALRQLSWQIPGALDKFSLTAEEVATLRDALRPGPAGVEPIVVADDFRIVGIFREPTEDEEKESWSQFPANTDLVLPRRTALDLAFRDPSRRDQGIPQAVLFVDAMSDVKEVVDRVKALDLGGRSAVDFIERQRLTYLLIFGGMTCVAGVALLVSSLGIANTMLMSVLQRRREIGIMKAVGATNRQLQALFIFEGALIGTIGGTLGLLMAWGASHPGDAWVRSMVLRDMKIDLKGSIFAFPGWIAATVVLGTVAVTTVAAFYPARHAAKVDPVTALRHD
ncbi:ABC transporter permease (plasmid) [Tundrisphaera sp. TA3]|uniref:ABC transporter permease n=1 Tax=Tundrisphaera sp. TA3 TaxID=3435775 RepID=UPI003EB8F367